MSTLTNSASHGKKWLLVAIAAAAVLILTFLSLRNSSEKGLQGKLQLEKKLPILNIKIDPNVTSGSIVKNSTDTPALGMQLTNSGTKNLDVEAIKFSLYFDENNDNVFRKGSENGINANSSVTSVSLYQDSISTANKVGYSTAPTSTGDVHFTNFKLLLPAGTSKKLIVAATVSAPQGATPDQFSFDIESRNDLIVLVSDTTNNSLVSGAPFNGTTSPIVKQTLVGNGTLAIKAPSTPIAPAMILAGTKRVKISRFNVKSGLEDFQVQKISLTLANSVNKRDINQMTIDWHVYNNVELVGTASQSDPISGGRYDFTGLNWLVPKNDNGTYFEVYVDTNPINANTSAVSGDNIRIDFETDSTTDTTNDAGTDTGSVFKAVGLGSSNTLTIASSDLTLTGVNSAQSSATVFKSIPVLATFTGTNYGCSGTNLQLGQLAAVYCFSITNPSNGPTSFTRVKISLSATNVDVGTGGVAPEIWREADQKLATSTATNTNSLITFVLANEETVGAGQTKYYVVKAKATQTNPESTATQLTAKIEADPVLITGTESTAANGGASNFVWSDLSSSAHSKTTSDWANGYKFETASITLK